MEVAVVDVVVVIVVMARLIVVSIDDIVVGLLVESVTSTPGSGCCSPEAVELL